VPRDQAGIEIAPEILAGISRRLAQHAGLELPAWVVEARAAARMAVLGIAPSAYVELIGTMRGAAELDELIEAVRVGESRLFRHRSQIQALIDVVVPALRAKARRAVRVWSAGCAAGEEPYTLAAIFAHALPGVTVTIVGSDVSADALEVAGRARFPASAWNDIPDDFRDAFTRDDEGVGVAPEIAALVRFERANLAAQLERAPVAGCDVVWCRNVLIYFTPVARKLVIDRLVAALSPGGYLFVGYSESLRDIPELEAKRAGDAVYYVRRGASGRDPGIRDSLGVTPAAGLPRMPTGEHPPVRRATPAEGIAIPRTMTPGVLVVHGVSRTPSAGLPVVTPRITTRDELVLRGTPSARDVTTELMTKLASPGLARLTIDLDSAELLNDDLAPVLRRARAAARAASVELVLHATRTGSRRWLTRHELDEPPDEGRK
jgi:chemotaxis protein methyltransferase CheR